ncbi:AI-2E family transporter [Planktothrix pseudagardhii]|uniref:Transport protein YueF n=1 Tax=Planktothrix pseudagardhii TaxID=132604 RepID=A0A9W4DAK5_9CYAN|nr:AI-2E family transporter [Planktothrix pseudagardhii]CAD5985683.1 Putative transport protein YueF [Planktothrix pseudagardhii]
MKLTDWIGLLCLIIALIILWQFRQILLLLFTSVVFSIAINSLVRRIQRFGLKRGVAVLLSLALIVFMGVVLISLVLPPFLDQFQELIKLVPIGYDKLRIWVNQLIENPPTWLPKLDIELPNVTQLAQQFGPLAQKLLGNFFAFFSNSIANFLQFLLVLIFALMLLADPQSYRQGFVRLFPSFYRHRADFILSKCETTLLQWMGGIVITSAFVAFLSGVGLLILGIPFVFAHALLAGMFNFVPNIGPTASVIFPVAVALLDAPWKALVVIILYVIIQNLESYWFSPLVMQKQVDLLPAITLTAQIFFATFFGVLGLVLALPLTVVSKTWIEELLLNDLFDKWGAEE